MDTLPNKLKDFLNIITTDHSISSWRINSGAIGLVLSIRFDSHDACTPCPPDKYYRAKPPSARHRDTERQQQWTQYKSNISNIGDSGYEDHHPRMYENESTPHTCSKLAFDTNTKHNSSMQDFSTHNIDVASSHNVHHPPHGQAALNVQGPVSHNVAAAGMDMEEGSVHHKIIQTEFPSIRCDVVTKGIQTAHVKTKNRKVEAFPECYDEHTQTRHVKCYETQTQTHQHGIDFGCKTEPINVTHSMQQTDSCSTENRHMQTFSLVKHKHTQYKKQSPRELTPEPETDIVECGDLDMMYADEGCTDSTQQMTEQEILMDKRLDEIIERLSVLDKWEERVGFVS